MSPRAPALMAIAAALASCTPSYPYLVMNDDCRCPLYIYKEAAGRLEIEVSAEYSVDDRVTSSLRFVFRNKSRDTLDMRQGHIKGTSLNVRYEANGRYQPLPFVMIPPGESYALKLEGTDTEHAEDAWLKIAGEKIVVEIKGLLVGGRSVLPIVFTLLPQNPKISS